MKERPILFSAPMVRAILDGRKTQTRRVVKGQEYWGEFSCSARSIDSGVLRVEGREPIDEVLHGNNVTFVDVRCHYGQPGDRLWVRETWATSPRAEEDQLSINSIPRYAPLYYKATQQWSGPSIGKWRPSIHMPRWASRITLEITGVRVERLQDISEADAKAEGVETLRHGFRDYLNGEGVVAVEPRISFCTLWESINGAGSWQQNPWVWVVEFRRVQP